MQTDFKHQSTAQSSCNLWSGTGASALHEMLKIVEVLLHWHHLSTGTFATDRKQSGYVVAQLFLYHSPKMPGDETEKSEAHNAFLGTNGEVQGVHCLRPEVP